MNAEPLETQHLKDVRSVRVLEDRQDYTAESEVNEALRLGWKLLLVQQGHDHPVFVVGWTQEGEPTKTANHQQRDDYSRALAARVARGNAPALSPA
jgi:hypothetical protein